MYPLATTPWEATAALGALALVLLAKVVMLAVAIRGARPGERPAIIRALAELTRSWPYRPGGGAAPPTGDPPAAGPAAAREPAE